jgi:hypothetical protein
MALKAKIGSLAMVLDVKGAYLKSSVKEEYGENIYLVLPNKKKVKLLRYIYGLKQAGKEWQENITRCLLDLGYIRSSVDELTFYKWIGNRYIIMVIHVDDFFVISSDKQLLEKLHHELTLEYGEVSIKTGDHLAYLGMDVATSKDGEVRLSQPGYIERLLEEYNPEGKISYTPISALEYEDDEEDSEPIDQHEYLAAVGALNHLTQCTRPDIAYAVSRVAQDCSHPTGKSWKRVTRIFKYLQGTREDGITYRIGIIKLVCFVDASYNAYADGKGHYGYAFFLGEDDGTIFARSVKMKLTPLSSTEAEYVAVCEASRDIIWIRQFLTDIGFPPEGPTTIYEDNQSCIDMLHGKSRFKASKHINPKFHFTRDLIADGVVKIVYCPTRQMVADVLTKALARNPFEYFAKDLLNIEE